MKILIRLIPFIVIVVFANAANLPQFSVSQIDINRFVKKCLKTPSTAQMKSQIDQILSERRGQRYEKLPKRLRISVKSESAPIPSMSLDGFDFKNVSLYDVEIIERLTVDRYAFWPFFDEDYALTQSLDTNNKLVVKRTVTERDKDKKSVTKPFANLGKFNKNPVCSDAVCAAQRIFGEKRGVAILWDHLVNNSNLSPYSDSNADPGGLSLQGIQAVLAAYQALPDHLRESAIMNSGFYRFLKGYSLAMYNGAGVAANAMGALFDAYEQYNFLDQVSVVTHELGHRTSSWNGKGLDEGVDWQDTTGWREVAPEKWIKTKNTGWVSSYAKTNPAEDFAETFNMYRFNPEKLERISPGRYLFMKIKVFDGIEYKKDICNGTKGPYSGGSKSPLQIFDPSSVVK